MSGAGVARRSLLSSDRALRGDPVAGRVAIVVGVIFVPAGLVKFVFHSWELHNFQAFGLPSPGALEILAGVLETGGGVLLLRRVCVVPVALLLAATMVVAIAYSGIGHGDVVPSLTLAPALLAGLVFLLLRARGRPHDRGSATDGPTVEIVAGS